MSGEKCTYVRLRRSEYQRLMRSCRRKESIEAFIGKTFGKLGKLAEKVKTTWANQRDAAARRQKNVQAGFLNLQERMRTVEQENAVRMNRQADIFQTGIRDLGREMQSQRADYTRRFTEMSQAFKSEIAEQRGDFEKRIREVRSSIEKKESDEKNLARGWMADAGTIISMIETEYRHEKFAPGALASMKNEFSMSKANFEQGIFQAAVASAQQTYIRASDLRMKLEEMETEWDACLEAAGNCVAEALAVCRAQEECRFDFDTEDGQVEVEGRIDFWTEGALSRLREKVEALIRELADPESLETERLKWMIMSSENFRDEIAGLSEKAREALVASQLRNNIGQSVESALTGAGWEITDAVYEGEDLRRAVHVKLKNLPGDEIVTIITPVRGPDDTIQNKVEISFFDDMTNDEVFRLERLEDITRIFHEEGLEFTAPRCLPGTEKGPGMKREKLDFELVRAGRAGLESEQGMKKHGIGKAQPFSEE